MKYLVLITLLALTSCMDRKLEATVTGKNGLDAPPCTVDESATHTIMICGEQAIQVPKGVSILGYIFPCGTEFRNDEILLRMSDGNILALYDGGATMDRLTLLAPGNYVTTDRTGAQCSFNVSAGLNITSSPTASTGLVNNPVYTR